MMQTFLQKKHGWLGDSPSRQALQDAIDGEMGADQRKNLALPSYDGNVDTPPPRDAQQPARARASTAAAVT